MKIRKIIELVDRAKENAIDAEQKVQWIAELDGKIAADVFLMGYSELKQFQYTYPEALDNEPLVSFPHDDIYRLWLMAQIDLANGEYNKYQNSMVSYNESYGNFVRWFARVWRPAQGDSGCFVIRDDVPQYYITAYGLAVRAGFTGTLEQWLESLKPKKGVDYLTDAEVEAAVNEIVLRIPELFRDISNGRLTEAEKAVFAGINGAGFLEDPLFFKSNNLSGFATWVYRQVGIGVGAYLGTVHTTFGRMFDLKKDADGFRYRKLTVEEGADPCCVAMLLDGSYSGKNDTMKHHGYEYTLKLEDYKIGDIFCMRYSDTLDGVWGDSCYYMALYQAENTFILYQDFGPHEQATNPSNVRVVDYAEITNIIQNAESVYYYVLRPENIAIMPVMEAEQRQAQENAALRKEIAAGDQKQAGEIDALRNSIETLAGKPRELNVGKLTTAEKAALSGLVGGKEPNKGNLKSMAEWAYGKAGIDVTPYITGSVSDAYWNLFPSKCVLRTTPSDYLTMLVPESYGGTDFTKNKQTSYELSMDKYQVGDLFCGKFPTSGYWVAVYLGENRFLIRSGAAGETSTVRVFDDANTIYAAQAWLYYFVLRPENIAIADAIEVEKRLKAELESAGRILPSDCYGTALPAAGTKGRIFFKVVG